MKVLTNGRCLENYSNDDIGENLGPPRQMLLGWSIKSIKKVLLLSQLIIDWIGYEFHNPIDGGTKGASEYKDVKAAGIWLNSQKNAKY